MNLAKLIQRQRVLERRQAESRVRGDQRHMEIDARFDQIEKNTARIVALEQQMAVVLAALPKIKGI